MGIKKTLKRMANKPETKTLLELYVGIVVCAIIMLAIGLIFARPMWKYILGVVAGAIGSMLQAYNMYDTLDRALGADEGKARAYITSKSMLRLVLCAVLMIAAYFVGFWTFVGAIVGLFSLKFSALINPLIKKYIPDAD